MVAPVHVPSEEATPHCPSSAPAHTTSGLSYLFVASPALRVAPEPSRLCHAQRSAKELLFLTPASPCPGGPRLQGVYRVLEVKCTPHGTGESARAVAVDTGLVRPL